MCLASPGNVEKARVAKEQSIKWRGDEELGMLILINFGLGFCS